MRSHQLTNKLKSDPIVYVDMDGTLADFFGEVAAQHNVSYWREIHRQEIGIDQIAQEPGFFKELEPMPNAGRLIAGILKIAGKYSILSSPLLSNVEDSSEEKTEWLQHHLKNHQPESIIFDHEKFKYARQADGTPNILIDDWDTNIKLWRANGGIGILYKDKDYLKVLHELKDAFQNGGEQEIAISEDDELDLDVRRHGGLYTARQVLKYVTGTHHEYHMPKPILAHKIWILKNVPVSTLMTPEFIHQDDPYRRVIDIDWDRVNQLTHHDIKNRPIVIDANRWVLDGNHRVTYARANGIKIIPVLLPYTK
ncbi:MAG TPA: hypothetical protein VFM18_17650 [Methanosarcina sp.]|nr:hypothetical protein [Methanosarcina sp.]